MKNCQFNFFLHFRTILLLFLCQGIMASAWAQSYPDITTWKVDYNNFISTSEVHGVLIIEGIESNDPRDRVAAFKGSECRGSVDQLVKINNRYYAFLTLGTNAQMDTVDFYIYIASKGKILPCTNKLVFKPHEIRGDVISQPYRIETVNVEISFKKTDVWCTADNFGYAKALVKGDSGPYQFRWNTGASTDSIGRLSAGKYRVTITDSRAIDRIDSVSIINLNRPIQVPILVRTPVRPLCINDDVHLVAVSKEEGNPSYRWYNESKLALGQGQVFHLPKIQNSMVVFCETVVHNCRSAQDSIAILVDFLPNADFSVSPDSVVKEASILQFSAHDQNKGNQYAWSFGDGGWGSRPRPYYIYNQTGSYTVELTLTNQNGCQNTVRKVDFITVQSIPGFSPGLIPSMNAALNPKESGLKVFPNPFKHELFLEMTGIEDETIKLECFDLWGRQLWQQQFNSAGNDTKLALGTQMSEVPPGVYILHLTRASAPDQTLRLIKQ